jgi:hypothetical protein
VLRAASAYAHHASARWQGPVRDLALMSTLLASKVYDSSFDLEVLEDFDPALLEPYPHGTLLQLERDLLRALCWCCLVDFSSAHGDPSSGLPQVKGRGRRVRKGEKERVKMMKRRERRVGSSSDLSD